MTACRDKVVYLQTAKDTQIPAHNLLTLIAQQVDKPISVQVQARAVSHIYQATRTRRTYLLLYQPLEQAVPQTPHDALSCRVE